MASHVDLYVDCIRKQLEELDMLSSIYCSPGEMQIRDAGVVCDFNDFLENVSPEDPSSLTLKGHLEYTIRLPMSVSKAKEKLDVLIELPHLYPALEHPIVVWHTSLLTKAKEIYLKGEMEKFISQQDSQETYVFQVITWIQEQIEDLIKRSPDEFAASVNLLTTGKALEEVPIDLERLWIYSHHIKSKAKRQEIVKQARQLQLSGFSRPGKPGIICVEGERENTQEFWQIIKAMNWQKIGVCKTEATRKTREKIDNFRRFEGFKEQLFCEDMHDKEEEEEEAGGGVMDMGLFIKFLEAHKSGYMKKELFGLS